MTDDPRTDDQHDQHRDDQHSDDHPLASPTELAGSTEGALAAEFAARDAEDALDADAAGAMSGAAYEEEALDGE